MKWILFALSMTTQHATREDAERFKRELISKGMPQSQITIMSEDEYNKRFI